MIHGLVAPARTASQVPKIAYMVYKTGTMAAATSTFQVASTSLASTLTCDAASASEQGQNEGV